MCFVVYLMVLLYYLLFADRGYTVGGYNTTPFAEITRYIRYRHSLGVQRVIWNLGGNILGFVPFGYLLSRIARQFGNVFPVILSCLLFSFFVEGIQLVAQVGCFDVDDIILNTVGGAIGCILRLVVDRVRRNKGDT